MNPRIIRQICFIHERFELQIAINYLRVIQGLLTFVWGEMDC